MTSSTSTSPSSSSDDLVKHLEFIQAIVARQAANSFLLKGWSITLVAGLFALAAKDANPRFAWLALLPMIGFGGLDAYYLYQEKRFRALYNWVRQGMRGLDDEARRIIGPFCLDPRRVPSSEAERSSLWQVLLSPSLWLFYGLLLTGALATTFLCDR